MAVDETRYRVLKDAGFSHQAALVLADEANPAFGGGFGDYAALEARVTALEAAVFAETVPWQSVALDEEVVAGDHFLCTIDTENTVLHADEGGDHLFAEVTGLQSGVQYEATGNPAVLIRRLFEVMSNDGSTLGTEVIGAGDYVYAGIPETPQDESDFVGTYAMFGIVIEGVTNGAVAEVTDLPFTITEV